MSSRSFDYAEMFERRPGRRSHACVLAGALGIVFGLLGIFTVGLVFVPIAALCTLLGLLRAVFALNMAGLGLSLVSSALTAAGFVGSHSLCFLAGVGAIARAGFIAPRIRAPGTVFALFAACLIMCATGRIASAETQPLPGRPPSYPTSIYHGPIVLPDFKASERFYASLRTRITRDVKQGPDFAGYLRVVQIGCGSGCLSIIVVDVRHGTFAPSPLASENPYGPGLLYHADSRLLIARWENAGETDRSKRCITQAFVWNGSGFDRVGPRKTEPVDICRSVLR